MSQIIETNKQNHAQHHGYILLDTDAVSGKQVFHHRLGDAIRQKIAYQYVDGESDHGLQVRLSVSESETLVEKVAQNAPEEVV